MMDYNTRLSRREREIAGLVATGASNTEIARALTISMRTVQNTLTHVFVKTGAHSRTELAIQMIHAQYQAQNLSVGGGNALP
jgi:DNA-binding NarL/FixJ family response regulator